MKLVLGLLFISSLCINAEAAHFSLEKIDQKAYEASTQKIKSTIAGDDTKQEILPFDKDQSFSLTNVDHKKIGYLIPVKFNSKSYRNTICRLFFLDRHDELKQAELFAEKNNGEDVVSSCVGIEAVSIFDNDTIGVYYLAVIRYRTVNQYGSTGVVVRYKNGTLLAEKNINKCIASQGETTSMKSLKKKFLSCM